VAGFWGDPWNETIRINVSSSYRISRALVPGYFGNKGFIEMPLRGVRDNTGPLSHEIVHIYAPILQRLSFSRLSRGSVYLPPCHELLKTTKSNVQRSNVFVFIFTSAVRIDSKHANVTALTENRITESVRSTQPTRLLNSGFCLSIHSLHSSNPCCSACSLVSNNSSSIL
jgi:hypothetical protein